MATQKKVVLDPSLVNWLQERQSESSSLTFPQLYNQMLQSYPGDPMVGRLIPNTMTLWEDSTETQSAIWEYYEENGLQAPSNLQVILDQNPGPNEPWNFSYKQWGLVNGQPADPSLDITIVVDVRTAQLV